MTWKITGAPGTGDNLLYSQADTPTLDLRFASTKSLTDYVSGKNLINFTRASNATYVDSQGIIRTAPTNLLLWSEEFDNASWSGAGGCVASTGSIVAPNGTATAYTLTDTDGTTASPFVFQTVAMADDTSYAMSCYLKSGTKSTARVGIRDKAGNVLLGSFDLENVTATANSVTTASITPVGNGWFRCAVTAPSGTGGTSQRGVIYLDTTSYAQDGTGTLHVWGAQLEVGSTATEYIPTSATINGAPRITHDSDGKCLGLLVEEARTNLLKYSEEADSPAWNIISSSVTVDPNVVTAPDGTQTADKVKEAAITGGHTIEFTGFAFEAGVTYACSCFIKAAERSRIRLTFPVLFTNRLAYFDLNPNSYQVISDGGTTASITPVGNDWFRVAAVSTATTTSLGARIGITLVDTGTNVNYTGDGTSGIYVWGAQLEVGAFPTSYIKTEAAQSTRAADIATITGTNFSQWYRQDEGTVFSQSSVIAPDVQSQTVWSLTGGTYVTSLRQPQSTGDKFRAQIGGTFTPIPGTGAALSSGATKACVAYSGTAGRLQVGSSSNDVTAGGVLDPTQFNVGSLSGTSVLLNGTISRLTYWPRRLPNPTLQEITQ